MNTHRIIAQWQQWELESIQCLLSAAASDDGFIDPTSSCDHYHHRDHLNDVPYVDSCHACVNPMDHLISNYTLSTDE